MSPTIGMVYDLRDDYVAAGFPPEAAAEFDSIETIDALDDALDSLGAQVVRIGNARALCRSLAAGERWNLVFNIAEGVSGRGREAQAPAMLELYDIPYTFSDPLVLTLALDKAMAKRVASSFKIPTPKFALASSVEDLDGLRLEYPLFAKPVGEGTSKGINDESLVESPAQLARVVGKLGRAFGQTVLIEEYLPGREFTVGITGTGAAARILGVMEVEIIRPAAKAIYSYENKERCEEYIRYKPLRSGPLYLKVTSLALAAYAAFECRDAGRVDVRCDKRGRPSFIEINPLPGLHPTHSDLPLIATQEQVKYSELIGQIVRSSCERTGVRL